MYRKSARVIVLLATCMSALRVGAQHSVLATGQFAKAVHINPSQVERLNSGASDLRKISAGIKEQMETRATKAHFVEAKQILHGGITEALEVVGSVRLAFPQHGDDQWKAADLFFGGIAQNFREQDRAVAVSEPKAFESVKNNTLTVFDDSVALFNIAAGAGSLTFDLEVDSEPQDGRVSYKRTGDPYTPHPNPTNTTIQNLEFAVWTVRVEKTGYQPQEKQHNPAREPNHVMHFTLTP